MDACIQSYSLCKGLEAFDPSMHGLQLCVRAFQSLQIAGKSFTPGNQCLSAIVGGLLITKSTSTQANGLTNEMSWHRALEVQTSLQVCQVSTFASQQESTHRSAPAQGDI